MEYETDLCHCGSTPFLLSARYGHIDVANLRLRHGANSKVMDCQGATPLHVAACHGHYSFINWLILHRSSFQIDHNSKNKSKSLHSAVICQNNKDIKPLLGKGARITLHTEPAPAVRAAVKTVLSCQSLALSPETVHFGCA